jgi:choline-sulfatase
MEIASNGKTPIYADTLDGRSLLPFLEGNGVEIPNAVYGEMLAEGAVAPLLMIRRDRYKYIYSEPDPPQLFDLEDDPNELINLADQQEYRELCHEFYAELLQQWDPGDLREQVIDSQQRRKVVYRSLRSGRHTPWDFQPYQDASQKYMRNHLDLGALERTARYPSPEVPKPDGPAVVSRTK